MRKITIYLTFAYSLFAIGCSTTDHKSEVVTLPWRINNNLALENLIDSIVIIPLESQNEDSFIKKCFGMKIDQNNIYISDWFSKKIVSFHHDGKFNTKYGQIGKAINLGEYLEVATFCTDSDFIYIIDNFNKKLFKFDKEDGKYISNYSLPNYYYDLEVLDNGNFIFLWYPRYSEDDGHEQYKLTITDNNFNILKQLYKATEDDGYSGKFTFLSKYEDKISYHAFYHDSIQLLSSKNGEKTETYYMEIDNKLPQDLKINNDPYSNNNDHLNCNFITSSYGSPLITDNYIFGNLYNGEKSYSHFFIYDLKNKEYIFPSDDFPRQFNGQSFCYYNGCIYCCVSKDIVDELTSSKLKLSFTKPDNGQCDFYIVKFAIDINP